MWIYFHIFVRDPLFLGHGRQRCNRIPSITYLIFENNIYASDLTCKKWHMIPIRITCKFTMCSVETSEPILPHSNLWKSHTYTFAHMISSGTLPVSAVTAVWQRPLTVASVDFHIRSSPYRQTLIRKHCKIRIKTWIITNQWTFGTKLTLDNLNCFLTLVF